MTFLQEKELLTGVVDIDEQHKKLFVFANRLEEVANKTRLDVREARRTIVLLGAYVRAHLSYEEDWGAKYNCQFNDQYKEVNEKFIAFYQALKKTSDEKGIDKDLLEKLYIPTKSWLIHHVDATKHIIHNAAGVRSSRLQTPINYEPQSEFLRN